MSDGGGVSPAKDTKPAAMPVQIWLIVAVAALLAFATIFGVRWPAFTGSSQSPPVASAPRPAASPQTTAPSEPPRVQTGAPPASATITVADLALRLGGVEARLAAVENGLARTADRDVQVALQSRLQRLESESSNEALRRAGLVLALATLARAAGEASPFKPQLDAIAALAPDDPAVAALLPYAERGVPTIAILESRFPDAAREALDAERAANAGNGLFGRLWTNLSGLIRVRRIGDPGGATNQDRLARAETHLSRRDLASAVMEVRGVEGEAGTRMTSWLEGAEARLAVETAIAGMETRIVSALAAPQSTSRTSP
jgi:hypothetical protein